MRLYLFLALLLVVGAALLVRRWRLDGDRRPVLAGVGLILGGMVLGSFSVSMLVYKPLLILHLAAMMLYVAGVAVYLWRKRWVVWMLGAPVVTLVIFFVIGWLVHYES